MSEWWSYRLSNFLMFSPQVYHRLFEQQNRTWLLLGLVAAILLLALLRRRTAGAGRAAALLLAFAWVFVAWTYFAQRYAPIHLAGSAFAVAFAVQGALLFWFGVLRARLLFAQGVRAKAGLVAAAIATIGWPLLAPALGRSWWQAELFALAPDPTALATLAVFAACRRVPWALMFLPLAWLLFSGATLWSMGSPSAALGPGLAALLVAVLAARRVA